MNSRKLAKEGLVIARGGAFEEKYIDVKAFYSSTEQLKISYENAVKVFDNQEIWEKLNLGQKLNVAKAYSDGIVKELGIAPPNVTLVNYKGYKNKYSSSGKAISIEDGFILNMSSMKYAVNVRDTIAHEVRHIYQYCVTYSNLKPGTLPPQAELDACEFARSYSNKTFGESKNIADRFTQKPVIQKPLIRKAIKDFNKRREEMEPQEKERIQRNWEIYKLTHPNLEGYFQKIQKKF